MSLSLLFLALYLSPLPLHMPSVPASMAASTERCRHQTLHSAVPLAKTRSNAVDDATAGTRWSEDNCANQDSRTGEAGTVLVKHLLDQEQARRH